MEFDQENLKNLIAVAELTPAEQQVLAGCKTGDWVVCGETRPDSATPDNSVRAALIRYLLLGGCAKQRPSIKGVNIHGAVITGTLDLENCETGLQLGLIACRFEQPILLADARIGLTIFNDSKIPSLSASRATFMSDLHLMRTDVDGYVDLNATDIKGRLSCDGARFGQGLNGNALTVTADVFLRGGFRAKGPVVLRGASIGGQLSCIKGAFDQGLNGNAMTVTADVFLRDGFHAKGKVVLLRASIGGQLNCGNGRFDQGLDGDAMTVTASVFLNDRFHANGPVELVGASIGGQLDCSKGTFDDGISLSEAKVGSALFWQNVTCAGAVNLHHARVGVLADDLASWENASEIYLNGFRYGSLESPELEVQDRLGWLAKNGGGTAHRQTAYTQALNLTPPQKFQPQPYRQLAKAYDDLGHNRRAARVREVAEQRRWASERWRLLEQRKGDGGNFFTELRPSVRHGFAWVFGLWFGYGHAPSKAFLWALGIILFSIIYYGGVYNAGQMAPNSDIILTSADWRMIADVPANKNPAQIWSNSLAGTDYETFSAIGYGIDLFVPLDALGQEAAWAPSKDRGPLGFVGFYLRWAIQVSGWVITAVGAAVLTGLVGRK